MAVVMALQSAPIYRLQKTWMVKIINRIFRFEKKKQILS
jgi:hypothetical protein